MQHEDFVFQVKSLVEKYLIHPSLLLLELTQSMLLAYLEDTFGKIEELRVLVIRLSLADSGTGYSSLQYVKKIPLDLKDRSAARSQHSA